MTLGDGVKGTFLQILMTLGDGVKGSLLAY